MKRATIDKDAHVGDPKFVKVPVERLISKTYAKTMAGEIARGVKAEVPRFNSGVVSKDTTHISVLDKDGNCFSMTHSLGMPSGVVTPGLGFMYNGCMGVFDPRPGRAGSIAPGKARFSSVVPSIIFKDGKPHLIIGAPGATQIAMGVLHAVLNALDFDMTMVEAVSAPRFSATSDTIDISNRIQGRSSASCRRRAIRSCAAPTPSASPPSTASACTTTASTVAPTPATTAWSSRFSSLMVAALP